MDDSAITCDEIIESYDDDAGTEAKSHGEANSYYETNFNEKKTTCKMQNFYILLSFYYSIIDSC